MLYSRFAFVSAAFFFLVFSSSRAQFQAGPLSPSASSAGNCSFAYGSTLHYSPSSNIYASDNIYASATHCGGCDANTSCLSVTGFGFSIPAGATILGIVVEVEKRASAGSIQDNGFRLLKNGSEIGTNHAQTGVNWPYTDTYVQYGNATDLWGATWTPAEINDPGFGVVLAAIDYSGGPTTTSYIDHVRVTVHYDVCSTAVVAAFSDTAASQLAVSFTDLSTGNPTSWVWHFGDGGISTLQNPVHTYPDTGSYTVCLIASDTCGSDTFCTQVNVCINPSSGFTYVANGLTVSFSDTSEYSIFSLWDFGDGNIDIIPNPVHTFSDTGTYNVCLLSVNQCGITDTACILLRVCHIPVAGFTSSASVLTVDFTDTSTDADTWNWDFGDGNSSSQPSPMHTYGAPGTYWVCLTAGNACYTDSVCDSVTVQNLGTADVAPAPELLLYPNPNDGIFYIQHAGGSGSLEMEITDMYGKIIYRGTQPAAVGCYQYADVPAGIYIITLRTAAGTDILRWVKGEE